MGDHNLHTYLRDHFAGSTVGLMLARRCLRQNRGTSVERFAQKLAEHISADRALLREAMDRVGARPPALRRGLGRLAGLSSLVNLRPTAEGRALGQLELLEAIALGISGRAALWRALAESVNDPRLRGLPFAAAAERAHRDLLRAEAHRLEAARAAIGAGTRKAATAALLLASDLG